MPEGRVLKMATQTKLEIKHISKSFPGVNALSDVTLVLKSGEIHSLVGENGAGKSTLINAIIGQLQPNAGEMALNGKPYSAGDPNDAMKQGIAFVPQELSMFPQLSVAENIFMGSSLKRESSHKVDWKRLNRAAQQALNMLDVTLT